MRKETEKKFDEEFRCYCDACEMYEEKQIHPNSDMYEPIKSFIDEHFVEKEEDEEKWTAEQFFSMARCMPEFQEAERKRNNLYTKEQVLEMIGEDLDVFIVGVTQGYNQAKAEIREKL